MNRRLISAGLLLLLGVLLGQSLDEQFEDPLAPAIAQAPVATASVPTRQQRRPAPPRAFTREEQNSIGVYESASQSVVNIDTKTIQVDRLFGMQRAAEGSGSGAVIDRQGHIITNYHVVDGAQHIEVTLASNKSYPAELVGRDKEHDIAVLRVDAPAAELRPIDVGTSENLRVGQRVYVLGNPFGWDNTMSTGIISSLNRNLPSRVEGREMQALIQTDAAMNPGNSGGPLLDSSGQMIGMSVAIATRTGQNSGVGFAIPIDRIMSVLPQLIEHGRIVRADIGIVAVMQTGQGLAIVNTTDGGPAAKAGLRGFRRVRERRQQNGVIYERVREDRAYADRIVAVDGEPMRSGVRFRDKIWQHKPGDVVTLTIIRDGRQMDVPVTLGAD